MILVRFLKPWGTSYFPGDALNVPPALAADLERDGTAERVGEPTPEPKVERAVASPPNVRTADAPR